MSVPLPADRWPRICLIQKHVSSDEYGFNLHAEKARGQYVGDVDEGSPADFGGLKKDDRIVGVNGRLIQAVPHKEVVQLIKSNPLQCELFVITEEGFKWYLEHGIAISYDLPNIVRPIKNGSDAGSSPSSSAAGSPRSASSSGRGSMDSGGQPHAVFVSTARLELRREQQQEKVAAPTTVPAAPRPNAPPMTPKPILCHLRKQSPTDEFGFNLHAERNKGHFIGSVDKGGIADLAGLETGQRIVGVNGELIFPASPHKTSLLVAAEDVDRWYSENGIPYSFATAVIYQPNPDRARAHSRHSTIASHHTNNSQQATEDAQTEAVYVPEAIKEAEKASNGRAESVTSSEKSASGSRKSVEDLQNIENAASGSPDQLLEQVFNTVRPPTTRLEENENKHLITNATPTASPPLGFSANGVDTSPLREKRPLDSPDFHKDENIDIFKMSAAEARKVMKHRKRDPRLQKSMTIEEKHQLIANL